VETKLGPKAMFSRHSIDLPFPFSEAEERLLGRKWVVGRDHGGGDLLAAVGVRIPGVPSYKHVKLVIGGNADRIRAGRTLMPISWHTSGGPPLFPRLDGHLELEAIDGRCRLALNASYDPPIGQLGELIDRALLGRLADWPTARYRTSSSGWPLSWPGSSRKRGFRCSPRHHPDDAQNRMLVRHKSDEDLV